MNNTNPKTVKLTDNQLQLLDNLMTSQYQFGTREEDIVGHDVWAWDACEGFGKSAGGVVSQADRKGIVQASGKMGDDDAVICMTQLGWDSYMAYKPQADEPQADEPEAQEPEAAPLNKAQRCVAEMLSVGRREGGAWVLTGQDLDDMKSCTKDSLIPSAWYTGQDDGTEARSAVYKAAKAEGLAAYVALLGTDKGLVVYKREDGRPVKWPRYSRSAAKAARKAAAALLTESEARILAMVSQ